MTSFKRGSTATVAMYCCYIMLLSQPPIKTLKSSQMVSNSEISVKFSFKVKPHTSQEVQPTVMSEPVVWKCGSCAKLFETYHQLKRHLEEWQNL